MTKKISSYIKLTVEAGKANPAPPIGPALGQKGVNIMEFCKAFNNQTNNFDPGTPIPVIITVYVDKSFSFITKTPPASFFLKQYAKVPKGSSATKKEGFIGKVSYIDCKKIAEIKMKDLNSNNIESAIKTIKGSANSMGIEISNE